MTEKTVPISDAFSNMTNTPEFADLLGSVFGKLQKGMPDLENELDINDLTNINTNDLTNINTNDTDPDIDINEIDCSNNSDNNSDILDCEVSSANDDLEIINFKITELNNSIIKVFTDKDGNSIADILSDMSNNIKKLVEHTEK